jgi:hypothetical protein
MEPQTTTTAGTRTTADQSQRRSRNIIRLRRFMLVMIGLITVIAAFYAVEDWRGKRAWERCKRDIEGKGQIIDWAALVPPPVPDEQNFFKAPKMSEWMAGRGQTELTKAITISATPHDLPIANVRIVPTDFSSPTTTNDIVLRYGSPDIKVTAEQFLQKAIGDTQHGTLDEWFVSSIPDSPQLPTIYLQTSDPVSPTNLPRIFAQGRAFYRPPDKKVGGGTDFRLELVASNSYRLYFQPGVYIAAEYLKACEAFEPKLALVRSALNRPYARMDGDYEHPYNITIPNFVTFRCIAQNLSQQTQCYFLTQQPDKALDQLTFIHKLCQVLEARPTSHPMTLVAAMINVAIQGLYCNVISEGLKKHAWSDAQLQELQAQTQDLNVLPFVESAIEGERISMARTLQSPKSEVADLFTKFSSPPNRGSFAGNAWHRWRNPLYVSIRLAPRGWYYQNMVSIADAMQPVINVFDKPQNQISPQKAGAAMIKIDRLVSHPTPYNFVAALAIPNFIRAFQTAAKNQTWINLTYLACALERYHLAHNDYPETLNALVPQFADHIPHDIINGQPLHYHRTDDGHFKLYSVGWDEKDNGGAPEKLTNGEPTGDWVWQYPLP